MALSWLDLRDLEPAIRARLLRLRDEHGYTAEVMHSYCTDGDERFSRFQRWLTPKGLETASYKKVEHLARILDGVRAMESECE